MHFFSFFTTYAILITAGAKAKLLARVVVKLVSPSASTHKLAAGKVCALCKRAREIAQGLKITYPT